MRMLVHVRAKVTSRKGSGMPVNAMSPKSQRDGKRADVKKRQQAQAQAVSQVKAAQRASKAQAARAAQAAKADDVEDARNKAEQTAKAAKKQGDGDRK